MAYRMIFCSSSLVITQAGPLQSRSHYGIRSPLFLRMEDFLSNRICHMRVNGILYLGIVEFFKHPYLNLFFSMYLWLTWHSISGLTFHCFVVILCKPTHENRQTHYIMAKIYSSHQESINSSDNTT